MTPNPGTARSTTTREGIPIKYIRVIYWPDRNIPSPSMAAVLVAGWQKNGLPSDAMLEGDDVPVGCGAVCTLASDGSLAAALPDFDRKGSDVVVLAADQDNERWIQWHAGNLNPVDLGTIRAAVIVDSDGSRLVPNTAQT